MRKALSPAPVLRSSSTQVTLTQSAPRPSSTAATSHAQPAFAHWSWAVAATGSGASFTDCTACSSMPASGPAGGAMQISADREGVLRLNVFIDSG